MSRTTDESDNGKPSEDLPDSPSIDEDSGGGSGPAGGNALKKGPWTAAEDAILIEYVKKHGEGNWNAVQKHSGLSRCGKSCRLRWANHLRPNLKKGAFTPEEEQLIIQLHAKLGNKWARMATHLPGRTDNEIKNYWNTRIKRRQRAGLPLYPPNMHLQAKIENTQDQATDEFGIGDKQQNELLQNNSDILDAIFPEYIANNGIMPYVPPFPDISFGNIIHQGLGSHGSGLIDSTNPSKHLQKPETSLPSYSPVMHHSSNSQKDHRQFDITFPYDPDPGSKSMSYMSTPTPGSHAFTNGNFSTSQSPQTVKSELPSLQFPGTDPSSWLVCSPVSPTAGEEDAYVDTPSASFDSECASPKSSGLLDALVHEAQAKCGATGRNRLSEKSTDSSVAATSDLMDISAPQLCNTDWEIYDPSSPLGCSAASAFSECTPTSGSSLDEPLPTKDPSGFTVIFESGISVPVEHVDQKFKSCQLDLSRPDALLAWSCGYRSNDAIFFDPIANLLGDVGLQHKSIQPGASSGSSQDFGFE